MAFCTGCGASLAAGARFCASCGVKVGGSSAQSNSQRGPTPDQRREILRQHVTWAAEQGARVESQGEFSASVVQGHRVNHLLHFLIGALTCGAWWIVWLIMAVASGEKRTMITVDEWGNVEYVGAMDPPQPMEIHFLGS
jgi:hypothetical protein